MKTVHIFDIDTTIADNTERAAILKKVCIVCLSPKPRDKRAPCLACNKVTEDQHDQASWDQFFAPELVIRDLVQPGSLEYAEVLRSRGAPIHFITGRSEEARAVTELWLRTKFNWQDGEELVLRADGENDLLASEYKERAWSALKIRLGYDKYLPYFYEDDPHVLPMYAKHGVAVRCPEAWEFLMPEGADGIEKAWTIL